MVTLSVAKGLVVKATFGIMGRDPSARFARLRMTVGDTMTQDILPQKTFLAQKMTKPRKTSGMSIFLAIILTCVLISLGEYILFDLNRSVNPAYEQCGSYPRKGSYPVYYEGKMTQPQSSYTVDDCRNYALLIHAAFAVPMFLIAFLVYFFFYYRRPESKYKILAWPFFIFSVVMLFHVLIETGVRFLGSKTGIYLVLGLVAALLTGLVILLQKKFGERQQIV